jgi:hypothetical protein
MNSTLRRALLLAGMCLPLTVDSLPPSYQATNSEPHQLTLVPEQAEVWNEEQNFFRYLQAKDLQKYMSLWDERFVGWPDYHAYPVHKHDIAADVAEEFRSSQSTLPPGTLPTPEAINVFGNVAVTYYVWPDPAKSSPFVYRITHTWLKGPNGWRIIGGLSCEVPRPTATTRLRSQATPL